MASTLYRAVLGACALAAVPAQASEPPITPRPVHSTDRSGPPLRLTGGVIMDVGNDREAAGVARYLADLSRRSGLPRLSLQGSRRSRLPAIRFVRAPGLAAEGYSLDADASGAKVTASSRAGFLYGAVSLWQLMTAAPGGRISPVHIEDAPRFRWRGLVLDSARHLQSPAAIARMIDWMALHKLNRLQWHLADDQGWRLEIKHYPRLTSVGAWRSTPPAAGLVPGRYGGVYTQDEVRRLVSLAAERNITIVPDIDMPGHSTAAILAYPKVGLTNMTAANLGDWGVFPSIYGVDAPAMKFLRTVLDEVMELFPSREIAIGGDEAVHSLWHQSPAVQAKMHALGLKDEDALQSWLVGQIGDYLNSHGRRLVGWDEILGDSHLPADDIVLSWHGSDGALAAARSGHDVVLATAPTLYLDNRQSTASTEPPGRGTVIALSDIYGFDPGNPPHPPGGPALDDAARNHVLGVQAALWTEHIASDDRLERMALPRAAAVAEIGWTASDRLDFLNFVRRLPAMLARYQALGLNADDGSFAVEADVTPRDSRADVAFHRQVDLGDIRYTTDGGTPTPSSKRYSGPFSVAMPARVRAASFATTQRLSHELDQTLDTISASRRTSQQLELCTSQIPLNLPGRKAAAGGAGPVYLIDVRNPCWIYRGANLSGARHIAVGVAALPFNYQFANEPGPEKLPYPAEQPELVVRRGCDGPLLTHAALAKASRTGDESEVVAAIPSLPQGTDLCLTLARPTLNPLWALGWVELRP